MIFEVDETLLDRDFEAVIVAGFTGRDRAQVAKHVAELAAGGVNTPARVPSFYLVSPDNLTQSPSIIVIHEETSGEAEIALLVHGRERYVTLASDHTDRRVERHDISLAKQVCPKVLARRAWPYQAVAGHWDNLHLQSWIAGGGQRLLYQAGLAGQLLSPADLLAAIPFRKRPSSFVLLCGTLPALGGIRGSSHFWAELSDPANGRAIAVDYAVQPIGDILNALSVLPIYDAD